MVAGVPDFLFHLTALAYICVTPTKDLSALIGKPRDLFKEKVMTWWESLTDAKWQKLTVRAFQELVESNLGNDFVVKDEPGAKTGPNL